MRRHPRLGQPEQLRPFEYEVREEALFAYCLTVKGALRIRVYARAVIAVGVASLVACHAPGADDSGRPQSAPGSSGSDVQPDSVTDSLADSAAEGALRKTAEPEDAPETVAQAVDAEPPPPVASPIETRKLRRTRAVYVRADPSSARRGRIPHGSEVHVFAHAPGPHCHGPWGQVASAGWLCLDDSELSEGEPVPLPVLLKGSDLPFVYARHRRHFDDETPDLEVFRTLRQLNAGADPERSLPAFGSYAFVRRAWNRGAPALITATGRAVSAADMRRFVPSEFEGRDLLAQPLGEDLQLAWALYKDTPVRAEPSTDANVVATLVRHTAIELRKSNAQRVGEVSWFELAGGDAGWVSDADVGRFVPQPPDEASTGRVIDVDLEEQTLALWQGGVPVFATLVSSGKRGDRTPLGRYRVGSKWAYSKMANRPSAPESYYVEAVPWAMYFSGRYAFHAVYWHNRFGQRMSHGCINLSPRDAKRVFEATAPKLPPGWLLAHEHAHAPGGEVRIRRGARGVPDRRGQLDVANDSAQAGERESPPN